MTTKTIIPFSSNPSFHWNDIREDINKPCFYYVAEYERYETDCDDKYFISREKAEANALSRLDDFNTTINELPAPDEDGDVWHHYIRAEIRNFND